MAGVIDNTQFPGQGRLIHRQWFDLRIQHRRRQYRPAQTDGSHHFDGLQVVGGNGHFDLQPVFTEKPLNNASGESGHAG